MSTAIPELLAKSPSDCTSIEIGVFIAFVRAGGEVSIQGLAERIRGAAALVFARVDGSVVGVSALKRPQTSYRRRVASESGAAISASEFPYELGWVYVSPELRGKGFSLLLSLGALSESNGAGVFATSRTENARMHRSLAKAGFLAIGKSFVSGRDKHSVQVFVRPAVQPFG